MVIHDMTVVAYADDDPQPVRVEVSFDVSDGAGGQP